MTAAAQVPVNTAKRPLQQAARQTQEARVKSQSAAFASPACSSTHTGIIAKRPHSFQIVKISYFGTENVNDHVVGIDQHPVCRGQAFDSHDPSKSLLDLFRELNRHRRNLSGERPEAITMWSAMLDFPARGMET